MKRLAFALLLAFSPPVALAQTETVQVDGKSALSGVWKIAFPAGVSGYMPLRGRVIAAGIESFCRLQQTGKNVSATCLPGWGPDSGGGELDGKNLHLAWGVALARAVIDARIESASVRVFDGVFGLKILGIRHDAPARASARKFVLDAAAPDSAGKAELLTRTLEELAAGAIVAPHDAEIARNFGVPFGGHESNTPEEMRGLGKVEAVAYLGEGCTVRPLFANADAVRPASSLCVFSFSAYQVEFTNGQRLCGIHQRADGVLDGFLCV